VAEVLPQNIKTDLILKRRREEEEARKAKEDEIRLLQER
jgi:hypothetical protein